MMLIKTSRGPMEIVFKTSLDMRPLLKEGFIELFTNFKGYNECGRDITSSPHWR
jgi:hypothetical protein